MRIWWRSIKKASSSSWWRQVKTIGSKTHLRLLEMTVQHQMHLRKCHHSLNSHLRNTLEEKALGTQHIRTQIPLEGLKRTVMRKCWLCLSNRKNSNRAWTLWSNHHRKLFWSRDNLRKLFRHLRRSKLSNSNNPNNHLMNNKHNYLRIRNQLLWLSIQISK